MKLPWRAVGIETGIQSGLRRESGRTGRSPAFRTRGALCCPCTAACSERRCCKRQYAQARLGFLELLYIDPRFELHGCYLRASGLGMGSPIFVTVLLTVW